MIRWFTRKPAPTPSEAASALARVKPEQDRQRYLSVMIQLRKELGMPPARVKL